MTRAERLSALDAIFLPMETETQSLHVGSVLILEGHAPTPEDFRRYVVSRLSDVPMGHRRVLRMPLDLGRPIWVDAVDFDPADHVHRTRLDGPADDAQLRALVAQLMTPRLDPARPLWELWQVVGLAGGRWAVIAKAHHTMVDGESGADLVQLLLRPSTRVARHGTAAERRPVPSPLDLLGDLLSWLVLLPYRALRLLVDSLQAPRDARRRLARVRFGMAQVIRPDLPPSVLSGPLGARRNWGWTCTDLDGATRAARAAGCTVNDLYLAALAGGYRRYLLERGEDLEGLVLRAIVPVSRRVPGRQVLQGNLASAMFVELPLQLAGPEARLAAVSAQTAQQKSQRVPEATAAVVRMADHIPAPLLLKGAGAYGRARQRRVNIVASNVRGPAEQQYLAGSRLVALIPYVPTAQEVRTTTAMVTCAGRLTIGITADAAALPDSEKLVTAVGRELHDLRNTLGVDSDAG